MLERVTYCYIYEANQASKSVFERLGYSAALIAKECAMPVFKEARISDGFSIERISSSDVPEVVKLINDFNLGRIHFEPFTPEAFEARTMDIPGYGLKGILGGQGRGLYRSLCGIVG